MKMNKESEKAGLKLHIQRDVASRSWHPVPSLHANRRGKVEAVTESIFLGSKITAVTAAMKSKDTCSLEEKL